VDFGIRVAQQSDAAAVSKFIRDLGMFRRLEDEDADVTAVRVASHLAMCLADDSHLVLVAEAPGGEVIGYLAAHWLPYLFLAGPEGHVSELFVDESRRGVGVGSALLDAVVAEARARGCARLMLSAIRTRESYERGFYQHRGWVEREDVANMVLQL